MTVDQFSQRIREQLAEITRENKPLFLGATTGVSLMVERIFVRGATSFNRAIGIYSNKPIYINPIDSPVGFAVRGKDGKARFNNGKSHKTKYFKKGYKQFRREIGRQSNFVNLRLTNDLQSDVSNNVIPKNSTAATTGSKPTKVSVNEYVIEVREENRKKIDGLQDKYGATIFRHTEEEIKKIIEVIEFELFKTLNA